MCDGLSRSGSRAGLANLEECRAGASLGGHRLLHMPDGMEIACQTATEARFLYRDIFEKQAYCRHGISLQGAQCVFDVGANIGLFTLFAGLHCPQASIFAFEPAPPLFEILKFNTRRCGVKARLFNHGLSAERKTAELTFYPNSSGMSTFYGDPEEEKEVLYALMANELAEGKAGMEEVMKHSGDLIEERLRSLTFGCRLLPLSDVIRQWGVEEIDLLKVDVQKSELDVVRGIDDEHWPLIRQVALELHNSGDRLSWLSGFLRERGFDVVAEQDEHYSGSQMVNLYAFRKGRGAAEVTADSASRTERPSDPPSSLQLAARPWELLTLSASSPSGLEALSQSLGRYLAHHPDIELADAASSCREGRNELRHRQTLVCSNLEQAASALSGQDSSCLISGAALDTPPEVAFLFPGLGNHSIGQSSEVYRHEAVFRQQIDRCAEILEPHLGQDLRRLLYPDDSARPDPDRSGARIDFRHMVRGGRKDGEEDPEPIPTRLAQPALFALEYCLARQWMAWGIQPKAMIGYSVGEYVAACLSGVFSLQDALQLVARRARMIGQLPRGSMLAIPLSEKELRTMLGEGLSLAAVTSPSTCVAAGSPEAVDELGRQLHSQGLVCRPLATGHAFHSKMMAPILESFARLVEQVPRSKPRIPYLSNVTGDWIGQEQAQDPAYWARHLRQTVRLAPALSRLLEGPARMLLEVGPGQSLTAWALQGREDLEGRFTATSLPHSYEHLSSLEVMLRALGKLWLNGVEVNWEGFQAGRAYRRLCLPNWDLKVPADGSAPDNPSAAGRSAELLPGARIQARYAAPRNELEERLCGIWQELLGLERVGIRDRFFEIGGDSLKAARLLALLVEEFDVSLPLRRFFQVPTVVQLSVAVVEEQASQVDSDTLGQILAEVQSGRLAGSDSGSADAAQSSSSAEESQ